MRLSTAASIGLFVVSTAAFAYSVMVVNNNLDTGVPEITMDTDTVEISIKDDTSKILEGVTAEDSRDGDVTESLVVENMSNFIETGVRQASIVAFDSDNHIARTTRTVKYTDYTSPVFALEEPLRFSDSQYDYMTLLTAEDCLDGDLTNKIHLTYDEDWVAEMTDMKVTYSVSNSMGETITLPVTLSFYDSSEEGLKPDIELTDYLIYVKSGDHIDPMDYLYEITTGGKTYKNRSGKMMRTGISSDQEQEKLDDDCLTIDNPVHSKPGVYEISYTVTDEKDEEDPSDDQSKTIRLIVVVTEA